MTNTTVQNQVNTDQKILDFAEALLETLDVYQLTDEPEQIVTCLEAALSMSWQEMECGLEDVLYYIAWEGYRVDFGAASCEFTISYTDDSGYSLVDFGADCFDAARDQSGIYAEWAVLSLVENDRDSDRPVSINRDASELMIQATIVFWYLYRQINRSQAILGR